MSIHEIEENVNTLGEDRPEEIEGTLFVAQTNGRDAQDPADEPLPCEANSDSEDGQDDNKPEEWNALGKNVLETMLTHKHPDWILKKVTDHQFKAKLATAPARSSGLCPDREGVRKLVKSLRGNKIRQTGKRVEDRRPASYSTSMRSTHEPRMIRIEAEEMQEVPNDETPETSSSFELVSGLMLDIVSGKINNVDTLVQSIRRNPLQTTPTNGKGMRVVMLNFDDDTSRAVLQLNDNDMDLVMKWYDESNTFVDLEETHEFVPDQIASSDLSDFLYRDIAFKHKDKFVDTYLPLAINDLVNKNKLQEVGANLFLADKSLPQHKNAQEQMEKDMKSPFGHIIHRIPKTFTFDPKTGTGTVGQSEGLVATTAAVPFSPSSRILDLFLILRIVVPEGLKTKPATKGNKLDDNVVNGKTMFPSIVANVPVPYNTDYDALCPAFGSNCMAWNETPNASQTHVSYLETKSQPVPDTLTVIFNEKSFTTLVLTNPSLEEKRILENHPEYGFLTLFEHVTSEKEIAVLLHTEFDRATFNDIEELNKKMFIVAQHMEYSKKRNEMEQEVATEEGQVKSLLKHNYILTDNVDHKMKASTLYDIILNSPLVSIEPAKLAGFKTRLAKYLKDLGLQKKRYNDGFYYYGILSADDPSVKGIRAKEFMYKRMTDERNLKPTSEYVKDLVDASQEILKVNRDLNALLHDRYVTDRYVTSTFSM